MRRLLAFILLAGLLLAIPRAARAQQYSLDRQVIANGGGTCSGGIYTATGTIGQIAGGPSTGGNFSLTSGFWFSISAPANTFITMQRGSSGVSIFWPAAATGFRLQVSPTLGPGASWQTVTGVVNNFVVQLYVPGARYYRLISP